MKQGDLIGASKDKIIFLILVLLGLGCSINQKKSHIKNTFLVVDFQDYFNNDTVGLKFNNCSIFSGERITTKSPVGFANFRASFFKERKNKYKILYSGKMTMCKSSDKFLKLIVQLNGSEHEFFINLDKGKYIGFSKKNDKELYIFQNLRAFIYE